MARKLSSIYGQTLRSSSDAPGISTSKNLVIGSDRITSAVSATDFPLQVSGGAYVSGSAGIGTTNPTSKLHVAGDANITGVVTATTFVGSLTGTATTATTANAVNTSNSYQVAALGIGQAAGSGTELDLAGRYAQTSIAVAALDIDCSLGNYFTKTITSSSTFTFSNIPASRSYSFTLCVTHDSGTITWPASVKWPKNTAPTLTTYKKHKFMFVTNDGGSVFYGAALVDFTY